VKQGTLFIVCGPSGVGKHTILHRVMAEDPNLEYSVSATTRPPRTGEVKGKDYYFLDRVEFLRRVEAGDFVEWAQVHDHLYGTLDAEIGRRLAAGRDVALDIDVQGMRNFKRLPYNTVTVFVMPPSLEVLEERLRARGTDSEEDIALRLRNAREEMDARQAFDYIIVNDTVDGAVADMKAILRAHRCRVSAARGT
jgi:guanylate kinase